MAQPLGGMRGRGYTHADSCDINSTRVSTPKMMRRVTGTPHTHTPTGSWTIRNFFKEQCLSGELTAIIHKFDIKPFWW